MSILPVSVARALSGLRFIVMPSQPARFRRDLASTAEGVKNHEIVTLMSLSRTVMFHKVAFDSTGEQVLRAGIFRWLGWTQAAWRLTT